MRSVFKKSLFLFSLSVSMSTYAQKTTIYTHEDFDFKNGYELFQKQKYSTAQKSFQQIVKKQSNPQSLVRIDAEYYSAICAIELFNRDGEALLKNFIEQHPESPKVKQAYFYLGKYNYRKKKYDDAAKWFEVVDLYDLSKEEVYELYFKRGYSYFILLQYDKAKKDFFEIKDIDTKYTSPARYYYSHISYLEKNYETALQGFQKLSNDENFGSIVPFYIAQIYYLQEKYDAVIAYAPALLDSSNNTKRAPEIAKILGESYYRTSKFKEAIPYLKRYEKSIGNLNRTDNYQLGYCFYKSNDIDNALIYLQSAVGDKDEITQNAYYHLADCYLKKNNKKTARNSFGIASSMDFSSAIKEDALFNYAKLSYELSYNPFSEAIEAFEKYIKLYPQSDRVDDAYGFLVNVYQTTKNYSKALQSIESIKNITDEVKPTYQKIAYFRAVELFNNLQFDASITHFDKALKYKLDKNINALSYYWKAEAHYRLKSYKEAIDNYQAFQAMPGAFSMKGYDNSNYGIGYSYFQMKEYSSANIAFRKYLSTKDKSDTRKINDAYIRTGDCYFMNRDYSSASENYAEAIKIKAFDTDYALYQKSLAMGLLKKNDAKISDLQSLLTNYPNSNYAASAHYELAKTYFQLNQYDNSMVYYKKIMDNYPNSSYINKSIVQIGLIYYNKKEDDNALIYFDKIVRRDKNSEEARQALGFIKQIYQAKGNIQAMEDYFREIGAAIPMASLDSAAYDIALNDYQKQDCINAIKNFNQYTQKFPDGIFITESNYYRAECLYKNGDEQQALVSYNYVISKNKNRFTEPSLVRISSIYYKNKNYNDALAAFTKLEENAEIPKNILDSRVGQMRCNVNLMNYDASSVAANKVISTDKVSNELLNEAHMVIAKAALAQERFDDAMSEFKALVNNANNEMGAEAKYNVAYIYYVKADYKQSEKNIFDLINQEQSYPHWMIKSLILLSDNYVAQNDLFQAKTTLKTVIENSDEAELTKIAQEKLDRINEQEKQQMQKQTPEELKVNFNGTENNELFKEPENKNTNEEKKDEQPK